ncbi:MAG: hypothetical protein ACE5KE_12535 [Methanosarcinales archaeon]
MEYFWNSEIAKPPSWHTSDTWNTSGILKSPNLQAGIPQILGILLEFRTCQDSNLAYMPQRLAGNMLALVRH